MEHMHRQQDVSIGELRRLKVTLPQAARVLDLDVNQVRKAIDRRVVTATYVQQGNRRIRTLDGVDILCLRMRHSLKSPVREQLYLQLKHAPEQESLKKTFHIHIVPAQGRSAKPTSVWLYDTATETLADIVSVNDLARLVDEEGKLRNSDVEAHRIAALVDGGMSIDEVLEDYPNLGRDQIEAATKYARARPKQGRPYPPSTAKSILRRGGGGGLADAFAAARQRDENGNDG